PLDILEGFSRLRRERPDGFPPTAVMQGLTGQWLHEQYHGNLYARAQNLGRRMSAMYDEVFANIDILVLPTTRMRAAMLPEGDDIIEIVHKAMEAAPTMMPFNISGHPAMNIPCGLADGLPVGLMAVGRRWEEGSLLAFAKLFEEEIYAPEPPPPRQ